MRETAPRFVAVLLLLSSAVGCSSTPVSYGARFQGPADIVLFTGITRKNAGLHDYVAVPSSRANEVNLLDPGDDRAVLSPAAVFPLAITTEPQPMRLAAASLGDRAAGGADLLVAVSSGSLDLQVVETWTATNRVAETVSLASVLGDGEVVSLAALTPPSASVGTPLARVLVGTSGGSLVVVDFTRDPSTGGVIAGAPTSKPLGFYPLAIAIETGGTRAFFASQDPISGSGATGVFGVGWVDAGADPGLAWPVHVIDAKGPTRAVATALVNERIVDPGNTDSPNTFDPVARFRVYAVLDASGCGPTREIACGVATLDENGLVADPVGQAAFRAPLPVPGVPWQIAISYPPAQGSYRITGDALNPELALLALQPSGTVTRNTSAVAAVTSTDGFVYLYDLSRYSLGMIGSALSVGGGVTNAITIQPADVATFGSPNFGKPMLLGLWTDFPLPTAGASVATDPATMLQHVQVTSGYTLTDTWAVTWQGELPELSGRRGVVGRLPTSEIYVALQANAGTAAQPVWVASATLGDPALGVHGGDLLVVTPDDATLCPGAGTPPELTAAPDPILAPDPALFPGGAVKVLAGSCFDGTLAPGQVTSASITFRASGLVLTSERSGYLGRPTLDQPFTASYAGETGLTGEALALARKLRRSFYPIEAPCAGGSACYAGFPWISDPLAPGPTIGFRVGLVRINAGPPPDPSDPATLQLIPRDSRIVVQTAMTVTPTANRPVSGGVSPVGLLSYDPSNLLQNAPGRFYAAYRDDQVLEFTPSVNGGSPKYIH